MYTVHEFISGHTLVRFDGGRGVFFFFSSFFLLPFFPLCGGCACVFKHCIPCSFVEVAAASSW